LERGVKALIWPLALIVLIGLVLMAEQVGFWQTVQPVRMHPVNCGNLAAGCTVRHEGRDIRLGMNGNPKPLAPFEVWVDPGLPQVSGVEARFTMEGMDMGFNLYTLRPDPQGVFRARVTLPICVTGRRDWNMVLDLGQIRLNVPFVTNL
jgi:hypothetical protein